MNSKIKVVVIDDEPLTRLGIQSILAVNPAIEICDEAGTGIAGLRLVNMYSPDIAIVDLQLTDESGVEVIKAIKKEFTNTRIVVASDESRQEAMIDALNALFRFILCKVYLRRQNLGSSSVYLQGRILDRLSGR